MENFWNNLPAILAVTFIFGGWVIGWVVNSIATNMRKTRESEHLAVLKQSMIERGMSADEIVRVVEAGRPTRRKQEVEEDLAASRV